MNPSFGLPAFDEALRAKQRGHILLACTPGVDATPLMHALARRVPGAIYLNLVRPIDKVRAAMPEVTVLDGYSSLFGMGGHGDAIYPADEAGSLQTAILAAQRANPSAPLIVEGLAAIMDRNPNGEQAVRAVMECGRDFPWTLIQSTIWGPGPAKDLLESGAGHTMRLDTDTAELLPRPRLALESSGHTVGPADIRLEETPMVRVPKVVLYGQGARSWLKKQGAHVVEGVAGDHAEVEGPGFQVRIVALPYESQFAALWPNLAQGAVAGIDLDGNAPDLGIPWSQDTKLQHVVAESIERGWT